MTKSARPTSTGKTALTPAILDVRGQKVILDADLAKLYGVETRALNQAVKRNKKRFPCEFMFRLTEAEASEAQRLRSQFVILNHGRGKHRKYARVVFTEHGALMAATILNSPRAIAMSVYVIRAFLKLREQVAVNDAIQKRLAEIDKTLLSHDVALRDVYQKLRPLLAPPADPPKPEIGFHVKEDESPYRVEQRALP
jgi:ORF6N domain-containing protein